MICVKFFAQNMYDKKEKTNSSKMYFEKLSDEVLFLIKAQRVHLEYALPNARIFCVISNEEVIDDNNFNPCI